MNIADRQHAARLLFALCGFIVARMTDFVKWFRKFREEFDFFDEKESENLMWVRENMMAIGAGLGYDIGEMDWQWGGKKPSPPGRLFCGVGCT
ncbi:MAG: hypothetical protein IJC15_02470 [Clostridia bacterium]|nr:hypothetical protein [Clostridia bacterium]